MAEFQVPPTEVNESNSDQLCEENPSNALTLSMMAAEIDEEERNLFPQKQRPTNQKIYSTTNLLPCKISEKGKKLSTTHKQEPMAPIVQLRLPIEEEFKIEQPSKPNYQVKINYHQPPSLQKQPSIISNQLGFQAEKKPNKDQLFTILSSQETKQEQLSVKKPKQLGKMVKSKYIEQPNENNMCIGAIDEQSQVLPEKFSQGSISHFEPARFDSSDEQDDAVFQQQKANQNNIHIKVLGQIKKQKNLQFQQNRKNQDSPIKAREQHLLKAGQQCQKQSSHVHFHNKNKYYMPYLQSQESNLQIRTKSFDNNSMELQLQLNKMAVPLRQQPNLRQKNETLEKKTSIVQTKGMMSSYGPIYVKPEIPGIYNGGKFSEDGGKRMLKPEEINKEKYLQQFQRSQGVQQKMSQKEKKRIEQVIMNKLQKIQKVIGNISDSPASLESQRNIQINNFNKKNSQPNNESKPTKQKIQNMQRFVPEQLINNSLSSVDQKEQQVISHLRANQKNIKISEELKKLKQKIKELQTMKSIHSTQDIKQEVGMTANQYMPKKNRHFSVNYKDYNQVPALKVYNRKSTKHQLSDERSISDDDFLELERLFVLFKYPPTPNDSPEQVTEIGLSAFKAFGVDPEDYTSMDLSRYKTNVQFQLERGPTIIWEYNGELYFGEIQKRGPKMIDRDGQGYQISPSKQIYKGSFLKNKRNGFGVSYNIKGQKYKGYWKNDVFSERGKLITSISRYDGDFEKGLKHGLGFQIFANGDIYDGYYVGDKFEGTGKYIWKNKTSYQGQFKKGYMDGQGIWRSYKGDSYEGQYYKNMKHGFGIYRWSNGHIYEGKFEHGHPANRQNNIKTTISVEKEITFDMGSNEDSEQYEVRMVGKNVQKESKRYTIRPLDESLEERKSPLKAFIVKK